MNFNPTTLSHTIVSGCVVVFNCILLILLPFSELIRRMQAQGNENSKIAARLESFERNMKTLLSNKTSTGPVTNNANIDATNSNANANSVNATSNSNIAFTSPQSSSVSLPFTTAPSNSKQHIPNFLVDDVEHLRAQANETALDLSDKIDDMQEVNHALKAQIATLEGQLQEQRSNINKTRNRMANRLDILEGYIQNSAKLEDQRTQENHQVQILSQRNTDVINQRIDALEEQLIVSFKEFEERRSEELQSLAGTSKSLNKLCDNIRIKLDKHAQIAAEHDKEIAKNTETIRNTFSSEALAGLGNGVRDALVLCDSRIFNMEEGQKKTQTLLEGMSDKLKSVNDTLTSMQTKSHALKGDINADVADVNGRLGWISENIYKTAKQLGFECNLMGPQAANDNQAQQTKDDEDETFQ